jgi:hypothetical protein
MASIGNSSARKLFAPHFLCALEACSADEIATLVQGTRPIRSGTYCAIEKVGRSSTFIEAYICYVLTTPDVNQLNIEELNGAMNYLRQHHPEKVRILGHLKVTLSGLVLKREQETIMHNLGRMPPPDVDLLNLHAFEFTPNDINPSLITIAFTDVPQNNPLFENYWAPTHRRFNYGNLSSLQIANVCFDWVPGFLNLENALLTNCSFDVKYAQFASISFLNAGSVDVVISDYTGSSKKWHPVNLVGSTVRELVFPSDHFPGNLILINHVTLQSPFIIESLADKKSYTRPHHLDDHIRIQFPQDLQTPEDLRRELDEYAEVKSTSGSKIANRVINQLLVLAILKKLKELSELGMDVEPIFEVALRHKCFSSNQRPVRFFMLTELNVYQRSLKEGYTNLLEQKTALTASR